MDSPPELIKVSGKPPETSLCSPLPQKRKLPASIKSGSSLSSQNSEPEAPETSPCPPLPQKRKLPAFIGGGSSLSSQNSESEEESPYSLAEAVMESLHCFFEKKTNRYRLDTGDLLSYDGNSSSQASDQSLFSYSQLSCADMINSEDLYDFILCNKEHGTVPRNDVLMSNPEALRSELEQAMINFKEGKSDIIPFFERSKHALLGCSKSLADLTYLMSRTVGYMFSLGYELPGLVGLSEDLPRKDLDDLERKVVFDSGIIVELLSRIREKQATGECDQKIMGRVVENFNEARNLNMLCRVIISKKALRGLLHEDLPNVLRLKPRELKNFRMTSSDNKLVASVAGEGKEELKELLSKEKQPRLLPNLVFKLSCNLSKFKSQMNVIWKSAREARAQMTEEVISELATSALESDCSSIRDILKKVWIIQADAQLLQETCYEYLADAVQGRLIPPHTLFDTAKKLSKISGPVYECMLMVDDSIEIYSGIDVILQNAFQQRQVDADGGETPYCITEPFFNTSLNPAVLESYLSDPHVERLRKILSLEKLGTMSLAEVLQAEDEAQGRVMGGSTGQEDDEETVDESEEPESPGPSLSQRTEIYEGYLLVRRAPVPLLEI